jgi:hypothetical protein
MTELLRLSVREYLALRATAAFTLDTITRMINLRGLLDEKASREDVQAALVFLEGLEQVKSFYDDLGSTKNWQITSKGVLAHERSA